MTLQRTPPIRIWRRLNGLFGLIGLWALLGVGTPSIASADISTDAISSSAGVTFGTRTFTHTVGATCTTECALLVEISIFRAGTTISSVTYAGNPLGLVMAQTNGNVRSEIWGQLTPTTGANSVVVTPSQAALLAVGATSFDGVDPSAPLDNRTSNTGTSAAPSVSHTTNNNGAVIVDNVAAASLTSSPTAPPALWTGSATFGAFTLGGGSNIAVTPTATTTSMSWTLAASSSWAMTSVSLKPTVFTRALVEEFRSYRSAVRGAVVEWRTGSEHATLGFHLLRLDETSGEFVRLNDALLPSVPHARNGGIYRFNDPGADFGEVNVYQLVEVETTGGHKTYGPYSVIVDLLHPEDIPQADVAELGELLDSAPEALLVATDISGTGAETDTAAPPPAFTSVAQEPSPRVAQRKALRARARAYNRSRRDARRGPRLKVLVREPGLYRVDAATIAEKLELSRAKVARRLRNGNIQVSNRGRRVATLSDADGLYFYGESIESQYTRDNVYFLRLGRGKKMRARNGAPRASANRRRPERLHSATSHAEASRYALAHLFDDPQGDYWMWDYRFGGYDFPSCETNPSPCTEERFLVPSPGIAPHTSGATDALATLVVRLHGATDALHRVTVNLNGIDLGVAEFEGLVAHTARFEVGVDALVDGDNEVRIHAAASDTSTSSFIYINDFDLTYPKRYVSDGGELRATNADHRAVSVTGFDDDTVRVLDITNPRRPVLIAGARTEPDGSAHRVSFRLRRHNRMFYAFTESAVRAPHAVFADRRSNLRRVRRDVDWLAITGSTLLEAADELAAHRASAGLRVATVDVEDIYDEFSHGIVDPDAIWAFLRYAHRRWRTGPRYVLLAGEGSFDYKNHLGYGDALVPTLMTPTRNGLFPSDNLYADVVGNDWSPEFAIGRLPVIDAAELRAMVAKIKAYELAESGAWTRRITLAADLPDAGGDFTAESEAIAALIPEDYQIERIHRADLLADEARAGLLASVNAGQAFVNFVGHSGYLGLGNDNLLTVFDVPGLDNDARLPVVTALTCLVGQFGFPGQDFLGEALVTSPNGGAIAVWSPSGLSKNYRARVLGQAFYRATFEGRERILGEAILSAQRHYAAQGQDREMLDLYNLIGDPALVMK